MCSCFSSLLLSLFHPLSNHIDLCRKQLSGAIHTEKKEQRRASQHLRKREKQLNKGEPNRLILADILDKIMMMMKRTNTTFPWMNSKKDTVSLQTWQSDSKTPKGTRRKEIRNNNFRRTKTKSKVTLNACNENGIKWITKEPFELEWV